MDWEQWTSGYVLIRQSLTKRSHTFTIYSILMHFAITAPAYANSESSWHKHADMTWCMAVHV